MCDNENATFAWSRVIYLFGASAIIATFVMMGFSDLTLKIMSLGGLALGTGNLLDNAIVMLENIYRRREVDDLDSTEGAHVGAGEVTSAVVVLSCDRSSTSVLGPLTNVATNSTDVVVPKSMK